jgi:aminomethyltransferase
MVPFAGWEMPLKYTSIIDEHLAVREKVGLFDISHMGEILVRGENALEFLQYVTSNDVSRLGVGDAHYSMILNERGGVKDDGLVYQIDEQEYMVVTNAVNDEKIYKWFQQQPQEKVEVKDITTTTVMLALQGPKAQDILQKSTDSELSELKRFKARLMKVAGIESLVSRSGYTGEDGFELYIFDQSKSDPRRAKRIWDELLRTGKDANIKPCGLGARDSLRLEAGLVLYGYELTEEITPLEARIGFTVKFDKGEFIGREALLRQKEQGIDRKRIGLKMKDRGIPRRGHRILKDEKEIGRLTSGALSPTLRTGIGMGYAPPELSTGDEIAVEIHSRPRAAEVVDWPFHKRG